jgi:hypothetical protein
MLRNWKIIIVVALLLAALGVGGVYAADAASHKAGAHGQRHRAQPVMGTITAIDGNQVTLKPEVPAWLSAKLEEKGVSLPPLPSSVSFWIGTDTQVYLNSAPASFGDFKVGDRVAARLDGDMQSGEATARRFSDEATAQQRLEGLLQRRQERIAQAGRPVLGRVLSISGSTVTVKPEMPDQFAAKLAERGVGLPQLPESLSFTVGSSATVLKNNAAAQLADFQAGDEIGALVKGDLKAGSGEAVKFMDIASARELLKQKVGAACSRSQSDESGQRMHRLGNRVRGEGQGDEAGPRGGRGGGRGEHGGPGGGGERGQRGERPVFGKITAIGNGSITLKPEIPEFIKQRMEENGRELPQLPESLSFKLDSNTDYVRNDSPAQSSDFKVGDEIAAVLDGPARTGNAVALHVADLASAKKIMAARRGEGGPGGEGRGGPGGEGRPGGHRPRPMFGVITSVDSHTLTIKPEVPEFIKQRMEERGAPGGKGKGQGREPRELPAQITVSLDASTKYVQNSQPAQANPFKAGDKVAIIPTPPDGPEGEGGLTAEVVSDYASAEAKMKEHGGRGGEGGHGGRDGRGGQGGHGGPGGKGPRPE